MNKGLVLVGIIIIFGAGFWLLNKGENESASTTTQSEMNELGVASEKWIPLESGEYVINPEQSVVNWAGKKPFLSGYVNSGTLTLTDGTLVIGEDGAATGSFSIDMESLKVGLTATKPNQETSLEGHLKGERWFDVASHPTALFEIKSITPQADVESSFAYEITGDLTMKGVTESVVFPATIYQAENGEVVAEAATEIDRTKWGITAGSSSFFDNLADNAIDDMIALSFSLRATKQ